MVDLTILHVILQLTIVCLTNFSIIVKLLESQITETIVSPNSHNINI